LAEDTQTIADIPAEERQRADIYVLLARLLIRPPDEKTLDSLRKMAGGKGPLGEALNTLAAVARAKTAGAVDDEYHELFIGLDLGQLVPYASFYLKGALFDEPLLKLREDMAHRRIGWNEDVKEPEDHIAAMCEMMAGLILGTFGDSPASLEDQRSFFETHLAPWATDFFTDLEEAQGATFYMPLGRIGHTFMEIEQQAFKMAP
jgi:TorA maturation chaperone TorD